MQWETVSVKPVIGEGGRVTVPEDVIHSMKRNKVGLKGKVWWVWFIGVVLCDLLIRPTRDSDW